MKWFILYICVMIKWLMHIPRISPNMIYSIISSFKQAVEYCKHEILFFNVPYSHFE